MALISRFKDYIIITISLMIFSFGVATFLVPAEVVGGGVSGLSTLIYYYSGETIPLAVPFLIINVILLSIGVKIFGKGFGVKTVYAIIITTIFLYLWQKLITHQILSDVFLSTVIGGMCTGAGVGLAISQGGSTGGTDIIGLIVNHYWNIPPGRTLLYIDVVIVSFSYLVFQKIEPIIYGFAAMAVTAYFVDFVITGRKQSVQFFIFTKDHNKMASQLEQEVGRGISLLDSYGWHSQEKRKIVMIVTKKSEARQIFRVVRKIDPSAFVSMNDVTGVFGNGFEAIR